LLRTEGAAGTTVATFELRNRGSAPCALFGYVGLQMLDAQSNPLPTTVQRGGGVAAINGSPQRLVLQPGDAADFLVQASNVPTGTQSCPESAKLEVTPPDEREFTVVDATLRACGGVLKVSPVQAPQPG
jgi:hypothetical protein